MNSFSDIVGRKQMPEANKTTDFVMRKVEPRKALTTKLATQASNAKEGESGITDLLIQGLIDRLPKPDSTWPLDDRAKWLRTADSIFSLVYNTGDDDREISIAFVKQEAANPPIHVLKEESRG
jgi:hypothetical protein